MFNLHKFYLFLLLHEFQSNYDYRNFPISLDGHAAANCVDPDQTAPKEQSDQGQHCLPFHHQFSTNCQTVKSTDQNLKENYGN